MIDNPGNCDCCGNWFNIRNDAGLCAKCADLDEQCQSPQEWVYERVRERGYVDAL